MRIALALYASLWTGASAVAQDYALPTAMQFIERAGTQKARSGDSEWSSEVLLRYSLIGGGGNGAKWSDDFSDGFGLRGEGDYEYHINSQWSVGGYLSTGFDIFGGKTIQGFTLDDLLVIPFTIGAKGKVYFGQGFFGELYLGFGFVDYSAVGISGPGGSLPVWTDSIAFALEVGGHIGYKLDQKFALVFGVGYENWGHPGVDQSGPAAGVPQHPIENVTIDLGIWFRF